MISNRIFSYKRQHTALKCKLIFTVYLLVRLQLYFFIEDTLPKEYGRTERNSAENINYQRSRKDDIKGKIKSLRVFQLSGDRVEM